MNPGLLDTPIQLEAPPAGTDDLGQPSGSWTSVGAPMFARRMRPAAETESQTGDRRTEGRTVVFRVRNQPFLSLYAAGHRVRELARDGAPENVWDATGWREVDGTRGMYVDLTCREVDRS